MITSSTTSLHNKKHDKHYRWIMKNAIKLCSSRSHYERHYIIDGFHYQNYEHNHYSMSTTIKQKQPSLYKCYHQRMNTTVTSWIRPSGHNITMTSQTRLINIKKIPRLTRLINIKKIPRLTRLINIKIPRLTRLINIKIPRLTRLINIKNTTTYSLN